MNVNKVLLFILFFCNMNIYESTEDNQHTECSIEGIEHIINQSLIENNE